MATYDSVSDDEVAHRIDQDLERERRAARVARAQRAHRREVAARAVAADGDPRRVAADLRRVRDRPVERGPAVVERRRKRMLGREPVVDRHHDRARRVRELASDPVELLDVPDDPTAAVQHDEDRQTGVGRRPVDAHRYAVGVVILDREDRLGRSPGHGEVEPPSGACHLDPVFRRHLDAVAFVRSQTAWACGCNGMSADLQRGAERAGSDVPRVHARVEETRASRSSRGSSPSTAQHLGGNPGLPHAPTVRLALIAQRVVLGGDHDRRRQVPEIGRAQRRTCASRRSRRACSA